MNERWNQLLNEIITVRDYRGTERGRGGEVQAERDDSESITETKRDVT